MITARELARETMAARDEQSAKDRAQAEEILQRIDRSLRTASNQNKLEASWSIDVGDNVSATALDLVIDTLEDQEFMVLVSRMGIMGGTLTLLWGHLAKAVSDD